MREAVVLLYAGPGNFPHRSCKKRDAKRPSPFCPDSEGKGKVVVWRYKIDRAALRSSGKAVNARGVCTQGSTCRGVEASLTVLARSQRLHLRPPWPSENFLGHTGGW